MRMKRLLGRKTAAIVLMGVVGLGLTGCFPDTSSTPPSDPFVNELVQPDELRPGHRRPPAAHLEPEARQQRRLAGPTRWQRRTRCTTRT